MSIELLDIRRTLHQIELAFIYGLEERCHKESQQLGRISDTSLWDSNNGTWCSEKVETWCCRKWRAFNSGWFVCVEIFYVPKNLQRSPSFRSKLVSTERFTDYCRQTGNYEERIKIEPSGVVWWCWRWPDQSFEKKDQFRDSRCRSEIERPLAGGIQNSCCLWRSRIGVWRAHRSPRGDVGIGTSKNVIGVDLSSSGCHCISWEAAKLIEGIVCKWVVQDLHHTQDQRTRGDLRIWESDNDRSQVEYIMDVLAENTIVWWTMVFHLKKS